MFSMDTDIYQIRNAPIDSIENGLYIIKNDNWYANIGAGGLVTIGFRTKDDEYKYYVYNFSGESNGDELSFSRARVTIYFGNNESKTIEEWVL